MNRRTFTLFLVSLCVALLVFAPARPVHALMGFDEWDSYVGSDSPTYDESYYESSYESSYDPGYQETSYESSYDAGEASYYAEATYAAGCGPVAEGDLTCGDGDCDDDGYSNPVVYGGDDCDDANTCTGGGCASLYCNNGSCESSNENCSSCPGDCGSCPVTPVCPDNICSPGEDCPADCDGSPGCLANDNDCDGVLGPPYGTDCNDSDPGIGAGCMSYVCNDPAPCDTGVKNATNCPTQCGTQGCTTADCDQDGYTRPDAQGTDCNDSDAAINPGTAEMCDGKDNNCAGGVDEGGVCSGSCLDGDCDDDGYIGQWSQGTDCDDQSANIHPGATESCNDRDDDCDGLKDEDSFGVPNGICGGGGCPGDTDCDGWTAAQGDCNDANPSMHPGAPEVCDESDNDCDGQWNEGLPYCNQSVNPQIDPWVTLNLEATGPTSIFAHGTVGCTGPYCGALSNVYGDYSFGVRVEGGGQGRSHDFGSSGCYDVSLTGHFEYPDLSGNTVVEDITVTRNICLEAGNPTGPAACSDGTDNDGDGWTDYNQDPGCGGNPNKDNETGGLNCNAADQCVETGSYSSDCYTSSDCGPQTAQKTTVCETQPNGYAICKEVDGNTQPQCVLGSNATCPQPTAECSLTASPIALVWPQNVSRLTWACQHVNNCQLADNRGGISVGVDPDGTRLVNPAATTVYTLACRHVITNNPVSKSATVSVFRFDSSGVLRELNPREGILILPIPPMFPSGNPAGSTGQGFRAGDYFEFEDNQRNDENGSGLFEGLLDIFR